MSFIGLMSSKNNNNRPNAVVCEKGHVGVRFYVASCVQRECVVGGGEEYQIPN